MKKSVLFALACAFLTRSTPAMAKSLLQEAVFEAEYKFVDSKNAKRVAQMDVRFGTGTVVPWNPLNPTAAHKYVAFGNAFLVLAPQGAAQTSSDVAFGYVWTEGSTKRFLAVGNSVSGPTGPNAGRTISYTVTGRTRAPAPEEPVIAREWRIEESTTMTEAVELRPGDTIHIAEGATLTLNAQLQAPDHQHVFMGEGQVKFNAPGPNNVSVCWFGADSTGEEPENTTRAFRLAIESVKDVKGSVYVPQGDYQVEWLGDTVVGHEVFGPIPNCIKLYDGIELYGEGDSSRIFLSKADDPADDPLGSEEIPNIVSWDQYQHDVTVHELFLDGSRPRKPDLPALKSGYAIWSDRSDNSHIYNLRIEDVQGAISLRLSEGSRIHDNRIGGLWLTSGVKLATCTGCTVNDNTMVASGPVDERSNGTSSMGLVVTEGSYSNTFADNRMENLYFEGIVLEGHGGAVSNLFTGNSVRNARWGIIIRAGQDNVFDENVVTDCQSGVELVRPKTTEKPWLSTDKVQGNIFTANWVVNCGDGYNPSVKLGPGEDPTDSDDEPDVTDNVFSENIVVINQKFDNKFPGAAIEVIAPNSVVLDNTLLLQQVDGAEQGPWGIHMKSGDGYNASGSSIQGNRIEYTNVHARVIGVQLHNPIHQDVTISENSIVVHQNSSLPGTPETSSTIEGSIGISLQYTRESFVRVADNHIRSFNTGISSIVSNSELSGNQFSGCTEDIYLKN